MRIDTDDKKLISDKNYQIAKFISMMISILGVIQCFLGIRDHNPYIIWLSVGYSVLMLITYIITNITKRPLFFYIAGSILVIFLETSFIFNGGTEGFGIIWIMLIPLFSVYIFSREVYIASNFFFFLILAVFFWTPLNTKIYPYSKSFLTRYPLAYFIEAFFGGFLQSRIRNTEISLQAQKKLLDKEIRQAALIQKAFYGKTVIAEEHWDIAYKNKPMAGVSGDLYTFFIQNKRVKGFGIYDISGHGISSGILTLLAKNIISQEFEADEKCALWETVTRINDRYIEEKGEVSNYLTGITVRLQKDYVEFVNAAHPAPILYKKSTGTFDFVKNSQNAVGPIGLNDIPAVYDSVLVTLEPGDELFFYTDGILECKNSSGQLFGEDRLLATIKENIASPVDDQKDAVFQALESFQGLAPASDDATVIILRKV